MNKNKSVNLWKLEREAIQKKIDKKRTTMNKEDYNDRIKKEIEKDKNKENVL